MIGAPISECPICGKVAHRYCRKDSAVYFRCGSCGTIYQDPLPKLEQMLNYAEEQYAGGAYQEYVRAGPLKYQTFRRRIERIRRQARGPKLLDVGCASGFMLEAALDAGFDAYGVEFSQTAISAASDRVRPRISRLDLNTLKTSPDGGTFDVVTAFDVLEHTYEPRQLLQQVRALLNPGGLVVISTPDTGHVLRPLMRNWWPMLQPLQHTVLFSRRSLHLALSSAGFNSIELSAATKVLTPEYLAQQLQEHRSALTRAYAAVALHLPASVRQAPLQINIGETLALARAA